MRKNETLRNLATATIPVAGAIFVLGFLVFKNAMGAAILPVIFFVASLCSNVRKHRDNVKRDAAGFSKKKFRVTKAYELVAPDDSRSPTLCLEIDNDKYLLTIGQWILNRDVYGDFPDEHYDEDCTFFNCCKAPYSFPSTEFEIWVSNLDGEPSKIVVQGDYLEPEKVDWPTPEKYFENSYVVIDKSELNTTN